MASEQHRQKGLCDGQRKGAHHSRCAGQRQEYSFVSAFITDKMSLSLGDIMETARLRRGCLRKRFPRYDLKSRSCN